MNPDALPDRDAAKHHECMCCPLEVRDLMATAHNLIVTIEMVINEHADPTRALNKLEQLKAALARLQPISDAHFRALGMKT